MPASLPHLPNPEMQVPQALRLPLLSALLGLLLCLTFPRQRCRCHGPCGSHCCRFVGPASLSHLPKAEMQVSWALRLPLLSLCWACVSDTPSQGRDAGVTDPFHPREA